MKIKGVIFDFDGVIVDSEHHWPAIENPYIHAHTTGWSEDHYGDLIGMGLDEVYEYLATKYALNVTKEQYFTDYDQMAVRLYGNIAKPVQGVVELLHYLKSQNIQMSIASSSKQEWIRAALDRHDMGGYFEAVVSSHDNDIQRGKPAPDVYIKALTGQQLTIGEVIAVEDSKNGIAAAKAAGLFCVGVDIDITAKQDLSQADLKITTYRELLRLFEE